MKKAIYVLSAALMVFASSCVQENMPVEPEGIKMVKATIKAESTDSGFKTTATEVDNIYKISWEAGDELSVFNDLNTTMSRFTATEGGESTEFLGEIPEFSKVTYAILPYDEKAKVSGTTVYTQVPKEQNGDFSNIILAGWPKPATKSESVYDFNYQFEAVCGIVKFHFDPAQIKTPEGDPLLAEGEKVVAVSITADRPLSGQAKISYAGDKPVMTADTKNIYNTVNLFTHEGLKKGDYYFATIPILKDNDDDTMGITVGFETSNGNTAHVRATLPGKGKQHIFTANIVKNIGTVKFSEFDEYPFSSGEFTKNNAGDKITFSRGNLQYRASDKTWRFALNQWDVQGNIGNSTLPEVNEFGHYKSEGPRATQSDWIDLFPWGHTGWNDGNRTYEPSLCNSFESDCYYTYYTKELNGTNGDWGYYNDIVNGDKVDPAGTWRVFKSSELNYILFNRTKNIKKVEHIVSEWTTYEELLLFLRCGIRNLGGNVQYGLLIFPDGFEWPNGIDVPLRSDGTHIAVSVKYVSDEEAPIYDASVFAEKFAGCVFIPSAGYRLSFGPDNPDSLCPKDLNTDGRYWTSDLPGSNGQWAIYSMNISFETSSRWLGRSVRLIKDVPAAE